MLLGSINTPANDEQELAMRRACLDVRSQKDGMAVSVRQQDVQRAANSLSMLWWGF